MEAASNIKSYSSTSNIRIDLILKYLHHFNFKVFTPQKKRNVKNAARCVIARFVCGKLITSHIREMRVHNLGIFPVPKTKKTAQNTNLTGKNQEIGKINGLCRHGSSKQG